MVFVMTNKTLLNVDMMEWTVVSVLVTGQFVRSVNVICGKVKKILPQPLQRPLQSLQGSLEALQIQRLQQQQLKVQLCSFEKLYIVGTHRCKTSYILEPTIGCDDGWSAAGTKCYIYSWDAFQAVEAQGYCSSIGGKLLEIENAEENSAVADLLNGVGFPLKYWIGINDVVDEGRYVLYASFCTGEDRLMPLEGVNIAD
jgi:hypothetical protein